MLPAKHTPFNFFTNKIEEAHRQLVLQNVELEPVADYGDIKTFDFKDPDGNILGFCQFEE